MLHKKQSRVKAVGHHWCLKETLRPWWMLTRYGILLDWCIPFMDHEHALVKIVRYIGVITVGVFTFAMTGFQVFRLGIGISTSTSVHSVLPYLIWFASLPITIFTFLCYIVKRKQYLEFFKDWQKFEMKLVARNSHLCILGCLRRTRLPTIAMRIIVQLVMLAAIGFFIFSCPDVPFLLSYYTSLRDIFTLPVLGSIHIYSLAIIMVMKTLCEFVPSMIFYHVGLEVMVLQEEVENLFFILNPSVDSTNRDDKLAYQLTLNSNAIFASEVRLVFGFYQCLRTLIERANSLFGLLMFQGYGLDFIVICTTLYSVLYDFQSAPQMTIAYFTVMIIDTYDFVSCTLLTSKAYDTSEQLRSRLATSIYRYWDLIPKEERDILLTFLQCLRSDPLAANPLGLYRITPSILLTMASLIVSYVIIMLQSN